MRNETKFKEYMSSLSEIFQREISDTLKAIYWKALSPYSDEACIKAFNQAIATCKFFPKPADLLDMLGESIEDRAVIAWTAFYKEMMAYCGESIRFSDPVIHSCVEAMGGIEFISRMTYDDIKWKRKEFCDLYRIYCKGNNHPKQITGIHDQSNAESGFHKFVKAPRFVMIEGGKSK